MKCSLWFVFLLLYGVPGFSQCALGILATSDSIGNYVFTATTASDSTTQYLWLLNGDTLTADSIPAQASFHIDSNGTYELCLHAQDTLSLCSLDTCITFTETNADYIPLLDSINVWHMFVNGCPVKTINEILGNKHDCDCSMYYTGDDTVIDGVQYKTLLTEGWYYYNSDGFIREDVAHRKVYIRQHPDSAEILLYDFAMRPGDSISISFKEQFRTGLYTLDSIKTMPVMQVLRRVFFLNKVGAVYPQTMTWIEGIGNLGGPAYTFDYEWGCSLVPCTPAYNPFASQQSSFITCFEHATQIYFDSCAYQKAMEEWCIRVEEPCNYYNICGAVDEIPSLSSFSVSPNPAVDFFSLTLKVKNTDRYIISILTPEGKRIYQSDLGTTYPGSITKKLSVADLTNGFYLVECKTAEGALYRKLLVQN